MKPQIFEYPKFENDGMGNTRMLDTVVLDDVRKSRLTRILADSRANDNVRAGLAKRAGVRNVEKSINPNPLLGARSNVFALCDATELGYGIYTDPTDYGNALLSWLDPAFISDRRRIDIPILDYRQFFNGGTSAGDLNALLCTNGSPGPARRGPIGKCKISYCFDESPRGYKYCVDQAAMEDFQRDCWQQPPLNLFGETFANDPSQHSRLDDFILMTGMKRMMVQKALTGSWFATGTNWDGSPVQESTGLLNFVRDFPQRHPELAAGTGCDCLLPKEIALPACPPAGSAVCDIQDYYRSVFTVIENRIRDIEMLVQKLGGGASIPQDYFLLVMNWQDAQCIQWAQSCLKYCKNVQYTIDITTGGMTDAQELAARDFASRFTSGQYGAGRIFMPTGRIIDIWAHPNFDFNAVDNPSGIPRGQIHLFCKGWVGGYNGGNRNAIRPVATQFSRYVDYLKNRMFGGERFQLMLNGTALKVLPIQCDNVCVVWNLDVGFSNAPWMQTRFDGFCPCNEVGPIATWSCEMPPITPNPLCAPTNI